MPRKPGQGPAILRVEGLSDGREVRAKTFVDDFSGEVRPVVQDQSPARVVPTAQEFRDHASRAKAKAAEVLLAKVMPKPEAQLVPPTMPGMRPVATVGGFAVYVQRQPWRRV